MAGLNRAQLIGHLGRDPEVRTFQNGDKVANLRIATSESWTDKQTGEKRERTEWHTVAIFAQGLVRIAEQYLRKGSRVYLEGQLTTRKWQDQSGADRYSTEIALRPYGGSLVLLGDARRDNGVADRAQRPMAGASSGGGAQQSGARPEFDDEIPF